MATDYISREAAIETVLEKPDMTSDEKALVVARLNAIMPSDVVEVVRFEDVVSAPRWISVNDRLPEEWQKVIVFWWEHDEPMIDTAFWQPDGKRFDGQHWVRMEEKITHWMPLPEPPEEGGGEDGK